jgi:hypothetical protein
MPWFHEECSKLLEQRKQAKYHCLQNPSEIDEDNLKPPDTSGIKRRNL